MKTLLAPPTRARAIPLAASVIAVLGFLAQPAAAAGKRPNDPFYSTQWGLENTGQTIQGDDGKPGVDVHAPEAWSVTQGSPAVKVAVIDTGIDLTHPDLAPNIDAADGANFVDPGQPPDDSVGHGTEMAGIIGAVGNNRRGVAGLNWSVSLIPEKVGNSLDLDPSAIESAINDAVANGARVVNMSFGSKTPDPTIDAEIAAAPQTLFVSSAGNDAGSTGTNPLNYPCQTTPGVDPPPNKVCVASIANDGSLSLFFSNSGPGVDLAAPGENIATTYLPGKKVDKGGLNGAVRSDGSGYGYTSGTSPSAAMVSGAAALLAAQDPSLDGAGLRQRILQNVDPDRDLAGKVATGGYLDVGRALGVAPGKRTRTPFPKFRDGLFQLPGKKLVKGPPTSHCLSKPRVGLRFGKNLQTADISINGRKAHHYTADKLLHTLQVALPKRGKATLEVLMTDTKGRPAYRTLRYRRC